jgi:hypothetical protein
MPAAGDSNPTRFIAEFQRIRTLPPIEGRTTSDENHGSLFNESGSKQRV